MISLGASGAGSVEGMALLPAIAYGHSERAWYLRLPPPHVAVVYFYEGNDLNNNLTFLERRVENPDVVEQIDRSIAGHPSALLAPVDWWRHFPLLHVSGRIARRIFVERTHDEAAQQPKPDDAARAVADPPNVVEVAGQAIELPSNLQSPAMELTRLELERAAAVYERSLAFLRKFLPDTPVLAVYLPSPLSSYRLVGPEVSIQRYGVDRASRYPRERVAEYSDSICLLIRAATVEHGAGFLDLRTAIRAASMHGALHGPRDFKHFNRKGMEVLGQAVAERINQPLTQESCSQSAN